MENQKLSNYQINKISYSEKKKEIEIKYELLQSNLDNVSIVLKSSDEPLKSLTDCLQRLSIWVEIICNFGAGYCDMAEIRGVSFSHSNNVMGAVITALIPVETANSPVCVNTPFLPSGQYNEGGQSPVLPSKCVEILNDLQDECVKYINCERKPDPQLELNL